MDRIDWRQFLEVSGVAVLSAIPGARSQPSTWSRLSAAQPRPPAPSRACSDVVALNAAAVLQLIRSGDLSAEEYAVALIAQEQRLRDLNTLISLDPDAVLAAARAVDERQAQGEASGRLAGLPLLVKDNVDTQSLPTTAGTPALRANRPKHDAPVLQPVVDAGALLFGKANMHELAFGITSNNAAFGAVRNPYNPGMIPGGSSGGTGAGVAARICPAGLGRDTGGSVPIPAALCGVVGLRPTVGRYPTRGIVPISHTRDTPGPSKRREEARGQP